MDEAVVPTDAPPPRGMPAPFPPPPGIAIGRSPETASAAFAPFPPFVPTFDSETPVTPAPFLAIPDQNEQAAAPHALAPSISPGVGGSRPLDSGSPAAFPFAGASALASPFAGLAPRSSAGSVSDPGVAPRRTRRRSTTAADWVALVLAVIAPPLGVVVALVDIIASSRMRGWSSNLAKSALGIAIALSLVVAGGVVVLQGIAADRARAQASLAAAAPLCALLTASPATLDSPTFGWPAPEESIPQSIAAMRAFDVAWQRNVAAAPAGVKRSVQLVESAAHGIITSVTATQTLDDAANVGLMQQAAAASGLNNWADEYCTG